ncbi:MAG: hypothetical protein CMH55_00440 [Myxococcales bacterium]|nr:hypothetical protein [Myxococcales bacterium]|tara:strand:- start:902 stop:1531 length:630 start_codon:yes stop_codon:yes gene_type:complete
MLTATVFVGLFVVWRLLFARAQAACQQVSDQCADAGFGWEVLAAVSLLLALLSICTALIAWVWRLLARVGRWAQLLFALGTLVFFGMAYANFITFGLRAKTGEAWGNLNKLRKAQASYHAKHGVYREAKRSPQPDGDGAFIWPSKFPKDSPWAALGWHLAGVRSWCQYEVEVYEDDFMARGFCDVDKDGDWAIFEASKDKPPRRMTPHH